MKLKSPKVHSYRLQPLLNRFGLEALLERDGKKQRRILRIPLPLPCHGCGAVLDARMRL